MTPPSLVDLFTEQRSLLFGIAYRMLGRVSEAEDMVQETWLRFQRQTVSEIQSPKAWLVATITRLSIDQLRSAQRQREEYYGVWLPEPLLESSERPPDEAAALSDSLTMAFMFMLETLSPLERAVFILRDVFDYEYAEIARMVDKSEANCRQMVSRAKNSLAQKPVSAQAPSDRAQRIVEQFASACANGGVSDLIALLADDATLYSDGGGRVRAAGRPIHTADHISRLLIGVRAQRPSPMVQRYVRINGRAGLLLCSEGRVAYAYSFDIEDDRIRAIYLVRNPDKLQHVRVE
jgi:RNA polymerase sigma-70 factor (ECF subfamily)